MTMARRGRRLAIASIGMAAIAIAGAATLAALDRAYPPPLGNDIAYSTEVLDRDGRLLRAFATGDGRWRLPVTLDTVDPAYVDMLIAYEDKRYFSHPGVDPLALLRAAGQFARHGRIVSGGSTITMQLARLLEPRAGRSVTAKLRQAARALQIERRLTKDQILERYLSLAPYGGNLEGVRAASLAWFGRAPKKLALSEAALLVALPQSPESRRPDRAPAAAKAARDRVLARMAGTGTIFESEVARASARPVPERRRDLPALAAHLADAARRSDPETRVHRLTVSRDIQAALETVAANAARRIGPKVSAAIVMADIRTSEIVANVGSAGSFSDTRAGWLDMADVPRSPGSTLKPLIYGIAFEEGVVAPETVIDDRPTDFAGYRPENFDAGYRGAVSVREALQLSLNVPAVKLLERVGPTRLLARLRRAGADPSLPRSEAPGLATGLGGIGLSLKDLVGLYAALGNRGRPVALSDGLEGSEPDARAPVLEPAAAWHVADILSGLAPPANAPDAGLAYKTGTSYGYRDAWAVGFDGRHVIGVWLGRADNAPVPAMTGATAAAPALFDAYHRSGVAPTPFPPAPAGAVRIARADLPAPLRRFDPPPRRVGGIATAEQAPAIVYPPDGARIDLIGNGGLTQPLVVKLQGGRAPFRWLANGRPLTTRGRRRTEVWAPDGIGASTLTVIDAGGRAASVDVFIE